MIESMKEGTICAINWCNGWKQVFRVLGIKAETVLKVLTWRVYNCMCIDLSP